jgi:hypothetical protein
MDWDILSAWWTCVAYRYMCCAARDCRYWVFGNECPIKIDAVKKPCQDSQLTWLASHLVRVPNFFSGGHVYEYKSLAWKWTWCSENIEGLRGYIYSWPRRDHVMHDMSLSVWLHCSLAHRWQTFCTVSQQLAHTGGSLSPCHSSSSYLISSFSNSAFNCFLGGGGPL